MNLFKNVPDGHRFISLFSKEFRGCIDQFFFPDFRRFTVFFTPHPSHFIMRPNVILYYKGRNRNNQVKILDKPNKNNPKTKQ